MEKKYTDQVPGTVHIVTAGLFSLNTHEEQTTEQRHTKIISNKLKFRS
jgi:hypothetical protein